MAFVQIDTTNGDPRFTSKLISALSHLDAAYAALNEINGEMQEMSVAQIEAFYGVSGVGAAVRDNVEGGFNALNTDSALITLRTQIG